MIDLNKYSEFVESVTSEQTKVFSKFMQHATDMQAQNPQVNIPMLLNSGIGLSSEGGEFNEIIKKIMFQGKPLNDENIFHMKRELGDVIWYWTNACRSLGLDPNEVIAENVAKLQARYPGGSFDAHYSENRQQGDL
jgi:NTP pyrophosphatase (non-canonical NTP hydrolase)